MTDEFLSDLRDQREWDAAEAIKEQKYDDVADAEDDLTLYKAKIISIDGEIDTLRDEIAGTRSSRDIAAWEAQIAALESSREDAEWLEYDAELRLDDLNEALLDDEDVFAGEDDVAYGQL